LKTIPEQREDTVLPIPDIDEEKYLAISSYFDEDFN
jgi:hypothetical protein